MRKLKNILGLLCFLLILASCDSHNGGESSNENTTTFSRDNTTAQVLSANTSPANLQKNTYVDYLLYASLSLNILCLVLIFGVYRYCQNNNRNNRLRKNITDVEKGFGQSDRIVPAQERSLGTYQQKPTDISESAIQVMVSKVLDRNIDTIVDRVLECIRLSEQEKFRPSIIRNNQITTKVSEVSGGNDKYMYASSADSNKNSFYKVTEQPDEDTIYKLSISGNTAQFQIYSGANNKILKAPDFLECACDVQKIGKETVVTHERGIAEKQADGCWVIINKAKIKFE